MTYKLLTPSGLVSSSSPGTFGGNKRTRVYGRLDCPVAARFIARGTYQKSRVFFADEATAIACGYRPCGICMPLEHRKWKATGAAARELADRLSRAGHA